MKAKERAKLRRGLLSELDEVFGMAIDMCGCHHPDVIDEQRREIRKLRREVKALLQEGRTR